MTDLFRLSELLKQLIPKIEAADPEYCALCIVWDQHGKFDQDCSSVAGRIYYLLKPQNKYSLLQRTSNVNLVSVKFCLDPIPFNVVAINVSELLPHCLFYLKIIQRRYTFETHSKL